MKIVFFQWAAPFLPGFAYQENGLAKAAIRHGDEVVVASMGYIPAYLRGYIKEPEKIKQPVLVDEDGVKICRLPFRWPWIPGILNWRFRAFSGVKEFLEHEKPDLIFLHSVQAWSLFEVADYLRAHPECASCADTHETYHNSANRLISKYVLHRMLYRYIVRKNIDTVQHFYYLTEEAVAFCRNEDGIDFPEDKRTLLPLGDVVAPPEERPVIRKKILEELQLPDNSILIIHSGKLERGKRTKELLEAFRAVPDERMRLIIIGSIPEHLAAELKGEMERDPRVLFLGWKSGAELREYLIAGDLYAQPGTESSTLNSAICCGSPVMLSAADNGYNAYRSYLADDKVFFVESVDDMIKTLSLISDDPVILEKYREYSYQYAYDLLDYDKQIQIIISNAKR